MKGYTTAGAVCALMVAFAATGAPAADLAKGGEYGDLEERIAELESSVVRKGNRKVTLTISGVVSSSVLWMKNESSQVFTNPNDPSRLTIRGEARATPDIKVGFLYEMGLSDTQANIVSGGLVGPISVRHEAIYVSSARFGTVWLGQTDSAAKGIAEINLANVGVAAKPLMGWADGFNGDRTGVAKYITPSVFGFELSASTWNAAPTWLGPVCCGEGYDAAIRYMGEAGGVRFAAGAGYRVESPKAGFTGDSQKTISGSASIMYVPVGAFITAQYGIQDALIVGANKGKVLGGTAGIERNIFGIGNTTVFGEYSKLNDASLTIANIGLPSTGPVSEIKVLGGGIVQSIDAAAFDLFVDYRRVTVGGTDTDVYMAGAKIRF